MYSRPLKLEHGGQRIIKVSVSVSGISSIASSTCMYMSLCVSLIFSAPTSCLRHFDVSLSLFRSQLQSVSICLSVDSVCLCPSVSVYLAPGTKEKDRDQHNHSKSDVNKNGRKKKEQRTYQE